MDNIKPLYKEYRCKGCEKLLFKGLLVDSEIEIKCKRCKELNTFTGENSDIVVCLKANCLNRVTKKESKNKTGAVI